MLSLLRKLLIRHYAFNIRNYEIKGRDSNSKLNIICIILNLKRAGIHRKKNELEFPNNMHLYILCPKYQVRLTKL